MTYDEWKCREPEQFEEQPVDDDGQAQWETEMLDYAADMKITTIYDPPPIPMREFDWVALPDSYDIGSPLGYGATEAAAIAALKERLDDPVF